MSTRLLSGDLPLVDRACVAQRFQGASGPALVTCRQALARAGSRQSAPLQRAPAKSGGQADGGGRRGRGGLLHGGSLVRPEVLGGARPAARAREEMRPPQEPVRAHPTAAAGSAAASSAPLFARRRSAELRRCSAAGCPPGRCFTSHCSCLTGPQRPRPAAPWLPRSAERASAASAAGTLGTSGRGRRRATPPRRSTSGTTR